MADKKKARIKKAGYDAVVAYDDDGNFGIATSEDRTGQGPRDRRKEDRRKADIKTAHTRRELSDRRNMYNMNFLNPSGQKHIADAKRAALEMHLRFNEGPVPHELSRMGIEFNEPAQQNPPEEVQRIRNNREIKRRGGELRAKIKSKKGGMVGLGFILGNAFNAGMSAYEKSKEQ